MKIISTTLDGVFIIEPKLFGDDRGFFMETYNKKSWLEVGLPDVEFVQDNHSKSAKGVLRGLHFQHPQSQGKLVRVTSGSVYDVVVDIREGSPTFGESFGLELSEKNKRQLWIPTGFAHGFLTLEDNTEFLYKCTDYYAPEYDNSLLWNDEELVIEWPSIDVDFNLAEENNTIMQKDKIGNVAVLLMLFQTCAFARGC